LAGSCGFVFGTNSVLARDGSDLHLYGEDLVHAVIWMINADAEAQTHQQLLEITILSL
jgi:hypothetical protein